MTEKQKRAKKIKHILTELSPLLTITVILLVWQAIIVLNDIPKYIAPSMTETFKTLFENFGLIMEDAKYTILVIVVGYIAGVALGTVLALIFTCNKVLDKAINPYILMLKCTPMIVLAPLLMLRMGFGLGVKILCVAIASFAVVLSNIQSGVRNVDPARYELMKTLRASKLQTFVHVLIPSALPSVFAGMRMACIFAVTGAVSVEFTGGNKGVAPRINAAISYSKMGLAFSYILVIAFIGVALYTIVSFIESKVLSYTKK